MVDKTHPGLIFPSKRYSEVLQKQRLLEAGATRIIPVTETWRKLFTGVRDIRDGDTVFIFILALVPTERGGDTLPPSSQPAAFMYECRAAKATVIEAWTGRKSSSRRDFDAMIADAVKVLREGSSRRAPKGFARIGRAPIAVPAETKPRLRALWKSSAFPNAKAALSAITAEGHEMSEATARRLFGKRHR